MMNRIDRRLHARRNLLHIHFRTDRITGAEFLKDSYVLKSNELKRRWEGYMQNTREIRLPAKFAESC